jgi:lipoate-protein ligase A
MDLRVISFSTPQENILFDQVLFEQAEQGLSPDVLRFWESEKTFIVLGKTSQAQKEIIAENVTRDHIPILRRSSAGGVVVQAKGCLNFTFVLSKTNNPGLATILSSYEFILTKVLWALKSLGIQAQFYPPCDLALAKDDRKFSGNAQRRGKHFILHHGTLLHHFDISLAEKYLAMPAKMPAYRKGRSHQDFMANLDCDPKEIIHIFSKVFEAKSSRHHPEAKELVALDFLLKQKRF